MADQILLNTTALPALLQTEAPLKWLFYGDSITHGALHTFGYRDYSQLFAERIRFELRRTQDVVFNTAISGDTTRKLLDSFDWRVAQFKPQVVLLMIGMNDCEASSGISTGEFRDNLRQLCSAVGGWHGTVVLQTTCPVVPGRAATRESRLESFMQEIRALAREEHHPLVDHTARWRSRAKWDDWMADPFHPNHFGHRAFARELFCAFEIMDPDSVSCRLLIP